MPAEFVYKEVETRNFTLASRQKVTNPAAPYKIYIEGDGYAFNAHVRATQNPTPRGTLVREPAFGDNSPNMIYLARPCQYIKTEFVPTSLNDCPFAPEVINAEYEAIKNIVGNNDKVMPPVLIREFVGKDDLIIEVSGASHNEGWGKFIIKSGTKDEKNRMLINLLA